MGESVSSIVWLAGYSSKVKSICGLNHEIIQEVQDPTSRAIRCLLIAKCGLATLVIQTSLPFRSHVKGCE